MVVLLLVVAIVGAGTVWMHMVVERERGPLPFVASVVALGDATDPPTSVRVIETARQAIPRAGVIDPARDPKANAPYMMTHPAFVLEWADGRMLLIDTGMSRQGAVEFGAPLEQLMGASPIEPLTTVAAALGDAASHVRGLVFTHLHIDHVDGLKELCTKAKQGLQVFMTPAQQDSWTLMTAPGKAVVDQAPCISRVRLGAGAMLRLEGFPGVAVVPAAGHTPGSQLILATTRDRGGPVRRWAFSGDITNTIEAVESDVPKPFLYRMLIVPEDDDRLGELRRYLRALEHDHGFSIVVSHDEGHLRTLGIPAL